MRAVRFQAYQPQTIKAMLQPMQSGVKQTVCAWNALQASNGRAASRRAVREWAECRLFSPTVTACMACAKNTTALKLSAVVFAE